MDVFWLLASHCIILAASSQKMVFILSLALALHYCRKGCFWCPHSCFINFVFYIVIENKCVWTHWHHISSTLLCNCKKWRTHHLLHLHYVVKNGVHIIFWAIFNWLALCLSGWRAIKNGVHIIFCSQRQHYMTLGGVDWLRRNRLYCCCVVSS